ncbi:sigma-54 interaction domain-containing protein [Bacterioplanoides sp.]|uniref:sigma-54 interaction domain-containing protein n=1 Tax=Bacterioplanoides sp. TaxID=2066072 RepID=UPI003AFF9F7F
MINPTWFFQAAAGAQIAIDPWHNRILQVNQDFCRLVGEAAPRLLEGSVSRLFPGHFPQLITFTEEIITCGRGWNDSLSLRIQQPEQGQDIRVEIHARGEQQGDQYVVFFNMFPVAEVERQRQRSDAESHYTSGIGHWNRVAQVFQEFERGNELLLDAAGEGIYGVDAHGITTFVNPAAERILGYTNEELLGRNMHSLVHHSHRDGSHFHACDCPIFEAFRDSKVHVVEDDVFWSKDGRAVEVEYTSTPIRDNGFTIGAVVIFRDVTQKKADQKKLLAALDEVQQLKDKLELENAYLQEELNSEFNHHQIIGKSPAIQQVLQQIELVAPTDATVLIQGESGTGKELIARALHDISPRNGRPLIRVNCAAIPEDLFESEFFGHVKGAFTGATQDRPGRFEMAGGGTLFLDEVGEIPLHLQGKLLRALQEQQIERVGDTRTRSINVRIVAATNKDLKHQVEQGHFREDLYFRLNVFPVNSVPLRQRKDDIPLLTQHFVHKAAQRSNKPVLKVPLSELQTLMNYPWPGNIRELENVIERQVILAQGNTLRFTELAGMSAASAPRSETPASVKSTVLSEHEMIRFQQQNLRNALQQTQGKIFGEDGAAVLLGIAPTTLASRIRKSGIDVNALKSQVRS